MTNNDASAKLSLAFLSWRAPHKRVFDFPQGRTIAASVQRHPTAIMPKDVKQKSGMLKPLYNRLSCTANISQASSLASTLATVRITHNELSDCASERD